MTYFEFADRFRALAPSPGYYVAQGLSVDFELSMIRTYDCVYRGTKIDMKDELLNLITNFDLSDVSIDAICFYDSVLDCGDFYEIGTDDSDPIIMSKLSHEIEVRDINDNSYTVYKMSANGAQFLDAIYCASLFLFQVARNPQLDEDPSIREKKARECAEIAGGSDYLLFYESILLA